MMSSSSAKRSSSPDCCGRLLVDKFMESTGETSCGARACLLLAMYDFIAVSSQLFHRKYGPSQSSIGVLRKCRELVEVTKIP